MEKALFMLALAGSAAYMVEKLLAATISLRQKGVPNDAALADELRARIRVLEVQLSAARDVTTSTPQQMAVQPSVTSKLSSEAADKAEECLAESKRMGMAAVEASGREQLRLLAEAKKYVAKAHQYRAIAEGSLFDVEKHDPQPHGSRVKAKRGALAEEASFEIVA
jgi:hypothetical protein